jgi:hypothetical protein
VAEAKYVLHFFFEWGGGCLWPGNDAAYSAFGLGPYDLLAPCPLALSAETLQRCRQLADRHDTSLNWDYPLDPGPWRQAECDRFNAAVTELLTDIRRELGPAFEVLDRQTPAVEGPDPGKYLQTPGGSAPRQSQTEQQGDAKEGP